MSNKLIKISLFIFYFLFFISFFDSGKFNIVRYIAIGFITMVYILSKMTNKTIQMNRHENNKVFFLNYVLFFVLAVLLFFSDYKLISLEKFFSSIYLFVLTFTIFPFLIKKIGIRINNRQIIFSDFLAMVLSYIIRPNYYAVGDGIRIGGERLQLFFNHPNVIGSMCCFGILLIVYNLYKNENETFKSKTTYYFMILLFLYLLYKSDSRTSMYCLIIFIIVFLFKLMIKNKFLKFISYSLILIATSITFVGSYGKYSYQDFNYILSYRLDYWKTALSQLLTNGNLFIGNGSYTNSQISSLGLTLIDNGYIYMIYQNGLIALIVILFLLLVLYRSLNKCVSTKKDKIFMESFFIVFLFYCIFENMLFNLSGLYCILVYSYVYYFIKYGKSNSSNPVREIIAS